MQSVKSCTYCGNINDESEAQCTACETNFEIKREKSSLFNSLTILKLGIGLFFIAVVFMGLLLFLAFTVQVH